MKDFGPYAAIELILPGGSLIAVLLWLYRRAPGAVPHLAPLIFLAYRGAVCAQFHPRLGIGIDESDSGTATREILHAGIFGGAGG